MVWATERCFPDYIHCIYIQCCRCFQIGNSGQDSFMFQFCSIGKNLGWEFILEISPPTLTRWLRSFKKHATHRRVKGEIPILDKYNRPIRALVLLKHFLNSISNQIFDTYMKDIFVCPFCERYGTIIYYAWRKTFTIGRSAYVNKSSFVIKIGRVMSLADFITENISCPHYGGYSPRHWYERNVWIRINTLYEIKGGGDFN